MTPELDRLYTALAGIPKPDGTTAPPLTDDERAKMASKLSATLGRKVEPDDFERIDDRAVTLTSGETVHLLGGNSAYLGDGTYYRNGMPWDPEATGQEPRW